MPEDSFLVLTACQGLPSPVGISTREEQRVLGLCLSSHMTASLRRRKGALTLFLFFFLVFKKVYFNWRKIAL